MPDGIDNAADAFRASMTSPETLPARDDRGRFAESRATPEPLFQPRQVEGDERGDTRDGGEDIRRREQEARANGEAYEVSVSDDGRQSRTEKSLRTTRNEEHQRTMSESTGDEDERTGEGGDLEGVDLDADAALLRGHAEGVPGDDAEGGEKYQVTVDGKPMEVTLKQALDGYIRTETFHQRMNAVNMEIQRVNGEAQKVAAMRDNYINQTAMLEQEIMTLLPKEPDWDKEYAANPQAAHALRKQYDSVAAKLTELRQRRMIAQQEQAAQFAANTETYAKTEFAKFVMEERIPDDAALRKEINSMRRTAMTAGFSEPEIATVYDSRMLKVLRKASKYDRLVAAKARGIPPGKGKALTPGSAPRIGNAGRRGIDEAQRRLANSGRLDDAASVFEKILR